MIFQMLTAAVDPEYGKKLRSIIQYDFYTSNQNVKNDLNERLSGVTPGKDVYLHKELVKTYPDLCEDGLKSRYTTTHIVTRQYINGQIDNALNQNIKDKILTDLRSKFKDQLANIDKEVKKLAALAKAKSPEATGQTLKVKNEKDSIGELMRQESVKLFISSTIDLIVNDIVKDRAKSPFCLSDLSLQTPKSTQNATFKQLNIIVDTNIRFATAIDNQIKHQIFRGVVQELKKKTDLEFNFISSKRKFFNINVYPILPKFGVLIDKVDLSKPEAFDDFIKMIPTDKKFTAADKASFLTQNPQVLVGILFERYIFITIEEKLLKTKRPFSFCRRIKYDINQNIQGIEFDILINLEKYAGLPAKSYIFEVKSYKEQKDEAMKNILTTFAYYHAFSSKPDNKIPEAIMKAFESKNIENVILYLGPKTIEKENKYYTIPQPIYYTYYNSFQFSDTLRSFDIKKFDTVSDLKFDLFEEATKNAEINTWHQVWTIVKGKKSKV